MIPCLVESVTESFPNLTIPKVEGGPTFKIIKEIDRNIVTNVASCKSKLGGGLRVHSGIAALPSRCLTITGNSITTNPNPEVSTSFPDTPTQP